MAIAKRKVRQLYIDGKVKQEFDSIREAAKSLGKEKPTDITHIIDVCRGRRTCSQSATACWWTGAAA